jgi:hypothetical protein
VRRVPHFITNAEVVILGERRYGVPLEYDDGRKKTIEAPTREAANLQRKTVRILGVDDTE